MKKILFIITTSVVFLNLGRVIDLTEKPKPTDIIVVLGGYKDTRIKEGLNLYIHNFSNTEKIIFPSKKYTKDVLKKDFLSNFIKENKINESNIVNLENVSNTMDELIAIKKYLNDNNLNEITIVTHPTHTLRIKLLANIIANYDKDNIKINFVKADHTKVWNKKSYFLEWESIKLVFLELLKIPYNLIKYTIFL